MTLTVLILNTQNSRSCTGRSCCSSDNRGRDCSLGFHNQIEKNWLEFQTYGRWPLRIRINSKRYELNANLIVRINVKRYKLNANLMVRNLIQNKPVVNLLRFYDLNCFDFKYSKNKVFI